MRKIFAAWLAFFLATPASAAEFAVSLPEHDDLMLVVPDGWIAQVRRPRPDLPPTVTVTSSAGDAIRVLITPVWPMGNAKTPASDQVKSLVEGAAKEAQPRAIEQSLPLHKITGQNTNGYYFSATDRRPGIGGYKYQTQGVIVLNELSLMFTILHNDNTQKLAGQALKMLRSAHQAPASAAHLGACESKIQAAQDAQDAVGANLNEAESAASKAEFADPILNDEVISTLNDFVESIVARSKVETDCKVSP